jgi:hypothetical protein
VQDIHAVFPECAEYGPPLLAVSLRAIDDIEQLVVSRTIAELALCARQLEYREALFGQSFTEAVSVVAEATEP